MKAVPASFSGKSFIVRVLACLLMIALLAPLTAPLSAKESAKVGSSPATITGSPSAPEAIRFSAGIAEYGGSALSFFADQGQWLETAQSSIARSIVPAFSPAFFSGALATEVTLEGESATGESSGSVVADGAGTSSAKSVPAASSALLPGVKTAFDFDGDGKADVAAWRPTDGIWRVLRSSTQSTVLQQWGSSGDRIVPADYDNDGKTDYAVYTPSNGTWNILQSTNGQTVTRQWGMAGDVPVPADYDGDGRANVAVWRPSTGIWYIVSSDGGYSAVEFGNEQYGDVPVTGDYDGDGKSDFAVWRTPAGVWYVQRSSTGAVTTQQWGEPNDIPVPADYDGDAKTDYAVWRPSSGAPPATGQWFVINSANGSQSSAQFGASSPRDVLVPADYDGDAKADFAVWRPSTGVWNVWRSSDSALWYPQLGAGGDAPVPAAFTKQAGATSTATPTPTPITTPTPTANTYDAVNDFSSTSIPTRGWSYGFKESSSAAFTPYTGNGEPWTGIRTWSPFAGGAPYLMVAKNMTSATKTYEGVVAQPIDLLNLHPGGGGEQTVVRWTAPAAGNYRLQGRFQGIDTVGTTTTARILHQGTAIWTGDVNGYGNDAQAAYNLPVTLATNETIDFAVGYGSNGTYNNDSTGLAATITSVSGSPTPTPSPVVPRAVVGKARLSPKNATGGTNLYSRNFSWGAGLVSLPGRAGMDAGLSLSYNSLVWTKAGNTMVFDADKANVAPGFRFGFPVIEPVYTDEQTNKPTYLMVTPSGARVELRQTVVSNFYESADSSYLQLEVIGGGTQEQQQLVLRATDGTQLKYVWKAGAYRCAEIKDSNGNYITVNHDDTGLLRTVTDTLGRIVTVNYDSQFYPTTITQQWSGGAAHTWATFSYTLKPISYNFGGLAVTGLGNGASLKVLDRVTFADDSSVRFDYNPYGQVKQINNYAADDHKLSHTAVNLPNDATTAETDCPRFTETRSYVEKFNDNLETVVKNSVPTSRTYNVSGASETGMLIEVSMPNHPNGAISKTYVGASGWQEGLPLATEDFADNVRKRWTQTNWTQDDTSRTYIVNPRVTESKVGDTTNTKRTTVDYLLQPNTNISTFGLVSEVKVYDSNQTTVLKKSTTGYNLDQNYLNRRIIGLASESRLYDGGGSLLSKVTYRYDYNDGFTGAEQNIAPVSHDNTNYGANFVIGRGNLTSTTRWDVNSTKSSQAVTSNAKYNTAGGVVSQTDPLNRAVTISYADSFNDGINNRNTYAYPTKLTDPASNFSEVKYRYDIGANVWAQSPTPQGTTAIPNNQGKTSERIFDQVGRLEKQTIVNTGAYTRYEYPTNGVQAKVFATVTAGVGEAASESWTDGAGRVRQSKSELPGSTGGWSGTLTEYDILGRVRRQSAPTEIDNNWSPAGNDLTRGFLWTSQEYDWKGRVTREVNTDGTDKLISYDGCGCAGGEITTVQGELVPRDDVANSFARRKQISYADILGRTKKTEVMNWNGTTPYTTTVNTFNGRDQVTLAQQYAGAETASPPSANYQEAVMVYDGHGRLKTQHSPPQDTTAVTTYNYNADDSIQSIVDARGAGSNYTYNSRGLVQEISYAPPTGSTTVPDSPTVTFGYDNAGNRISMTEDGFGAVTYAYNELSQMVSETRTFNDTLANAPAGGFNLNYEYTPAGQLKSLTDPYGQKFNYSYDKTGRLSSVAGSTSYAGISTYASSPQYNARGTLTGLSYGNGTSMAITGFNAKLQATDFEIKKGTTSIIKKQYQFYDDGSLKYSHDVNDQMFDRLYKYDNLGRTVEAKSGADARGGTDTAANIPYKQNFGYNAFGNILQSTMETYASGQISTTRAFTNNRNSTSTYDANGEELSDENAVYQLDAVGRAVKTQDRESANSATLLNPTLSWFDGTGQEIKRIKNYIVNGDNSYRTSYFIRSSVTGKLVSEVNSTGEKWKTFVSANGATVAEQIWGWNGYNREEFVNFFHQDASGASLRQTDKLGNLSTIGDAAEYDALGNNVGLTNPYVPEWIEPEGGAQNTDFNLAPYGGGMGGTGGGMPSTRQYTSDGFRVSESEFMQELDRRYGGAFGILEMSVRLSTQVVGQRVAGVRWGQPFTANYGADGSRSVSWGTYNPSLSQVNYSNISLVYNQNWTLNLSLFSFTERPQAQECPTCPKPIPAPAPTPTAVPTPTPKPYPNCYTMYQFIYENPGVQEDFKSLWKQTEDSKLETNSNPNINARGGREFGGWIFFDESRNEFQLKEFTGSKAAEYSKTGVGPDDLMEQFKRAKNDVISSGWSGRMVLVVHTHPNGSPYASTFMGDTDNITNSAYYTGNLPFLGIVIYGNGKITVYGQGQYQEDMKRTCLRASKR